MKIFRILQQKIESFKPHGAIVWLFLLALAVACRIIFLIGNPIEPRDGISYVEFTQRWFELGEDGLPTMLQMAPPLFCYLGRSLMYCNLSASTALLAINFSCGVLLLIPAFLIGKNLYRSNSAGWWLAGFTAVMPPLVEFSCIRLREGLYLFFIFWLAYCWIMAVKQEKQAVYTALCGAFSLLAVYCRYEALELVVFTVCSLPFCALFPRWQWRRMWWSILWVWCGVILAALIVGNLPGMPDIWKIFYNRIYMQCLGTSLNPL